MRLARTIPLAWCLLVLAGAAWAGKQVTPESIDGTTRVNAEEVIDLVESKPDLVIIDARKASDYRKGHIEGAVSLPNTETTPETLAKVIPSKETPVLFYCNGVKCGRSVKSAEIALQAGYENIYWFRGGIEEWQAKGLPLVRP